MKRLALVFLATACSPAVPDGKPLTTSSGLYLALASEGLGDRFLRPDGLRNEDLAGTERYEIADRLMVLGYSSCWPSPGCRFRCDGPGYWHWCLSGPTWDRSSGSR